MSDVYRNKTACYANRLKTTTKKHFIMMIFQTKAHFRCICRRQSCNARRNIYSKTVSIYRYAVLLKEIWIKDWMKMGIVSPSRPLNFTATAETSTIQWELGIPKTFNNLKKSVL